MSSSITRSDLLTLEAYSEKRKAIRDRIMQLKKQRQVQLGGHIRLLFENKETMLYQIQEMLRIEKIFEAAGIQEEIEVYGSLVPNGSNLKATMMIEYDNPELRKQALAKLIGIEKTIYFQVGNHPKVPAIANEDLDRETEFKTSSVHFLRFEFSPQMIHDFLSLAKVKIGVAHKNYKEETLLSAVIQKELGRDFNKS